GRPVVGPPGIGARLDHHDRSRVPGQQPAEVLGRRVEGPERVLSGGRAVDAGRALVPPQVDGQNGVGKHRKPPVTRGDGPTVTPQGLAGFLGACHQILPFLVSLTTPAAGGQPPFFSPAWGRSAGPAATGTGFAAAPLRASRTPLGTVPVTRRRRPACSRTAST